MSINNYSFLTQEGKHHEPIELAVFHLQDVCVRIQNSLRKHLATASLNRAPQIESTFRWLRKRGIRIVLLSDYDRADSVLLLTRLGWAIGENELIACIVPEQDKEANPVRRAMQLAGVEDPHRVALVADTPELLNFGTSAQIRLNLGVTSGRYGYQALQDTPCRALLDNTIQLVNYLLEEVPKLADAPRRQLAR